MGAVAREVLRRLWGAPSLWASPTAFLEHLRSSPLSSGKRMRAAHAQPRIASRLREAPPTAAATASAPILPLSLFAPLLQTTGPASVETESSTFRLLQMLRLQQQQRQVQHEARGSVMMPADGSSSVSNSSSSSSRHTALSSLPGFALFFCPCKTPPPLAALSWLPSTNAVHVYLQLKQAAVGEDASGPSVHAQCSSTALVEEVLHKVLLAVTGSQSEACEAFNIAQNASVLPVESLLNRLPAR
ncbi:hypothetical protein Esti_001959 [Eimeria stiedai]